MHQLSCPARFLRLSILRQPPWMRLALLASGLFGTLLASLPAVQRQPSPAPEHAQLVARSSGVIVFNEPASSLQALNLPNCEARTLRAGRKGGLPIHSLAGPDERGRIAFIENDMTKKRHGLWMLAANGQETPVFERAGDALWDNAVGDHLALDHQGQRVALVAQCKGVQFSSPGAYLHEGNLEVWDLARKERLAPLVRALDDTLAWFPDGHRLAFTALIDPIEAALLRKRHIVEGGAFASSVLGWSRVPAVHVLDVDTGLVTAVHIGQRPQLAPDGVTLLVRDFDQHWRALDLATNRSRSVSAPGAVFPGAIAFADPATVLYWAWPAPGSDIRYTENNSPLVGKKRMLELRLVDLSTGDWQTVVPAIDPRRKVSFGFGPPKLH